MEYSINKVVSENLRVKPLKEDQSATYKLCDSDLLDYSRVDERTGKPHTSQPRRSMVGSVTILDPFTKKRIKIMNVTEIKHEELPGGVGLREIPVVARVLFPHTGTLTLGPEHQGTYEFLERHPHNRDNPFRDRNAKPKFYRVDAKKKAIREMEDNFILTDAIVHVRGADLAELKAIYSKLDPTAQREINPSSFETLKGDLFNYAKAHPVDVMRASNNKAAKMRIQIMDAEFYQIITFFEDREQDEMPRRWVFTEGDQEITTLDITQNKIEGLAEFFLSSPEGKKAYQNMTAGLKKILTPGAPQPAQV